LALVLWRTHFEDGLLVSDEDVLVACAAEAGLSADDASRVLMSEEYDDEVTTGEKATSDQGIQQTPHFVFSHGAVVSGMQYAAAFDIVLR
jgi:predicted DsbA family dithiol-disulfide isomerase